ncbi:MAG TPA: DUF305 domain-containing protein [Gemmatimonadaceae bacterium]|nr:DUF305 domain-containing protein [Gemmatimonadaceae bacterium]
MKGSTRSTAAAGLLAAVAMIACSSAIQQSTSGTGQSAAPSTAPRTPAERAAADSGRPHYTAADVHFISGMIGHHAQAVVMAGWAPTHGAGPSVRTLCERIAVAQTDEIKFMQRWLRERHEAVPDANPNGHVMPGMDHPMLMPGMLTPEQMKQLDEARGPEFDRLFLTFMIQHHQGAITMVEQLMGSYGAAQDDAVFKFASDVNADQTTEIDRMNLMLGAMASGARNP